MWWTEKLKAHQEGRLNKLQHTETTDWAIMKINLERASWFGGNSRRKCWVRKPRCRKVWTTSHFYKGFHSFHMHISLPLWKWLYNCGENCGEIHMRESTRSTEAVRGVRCAWVRERPRKKQSQKIIGLLKFSVSLLISFKYLWNRNACVHRHL